MKTILVTTRDANNVLTHEEVACHAVRGAFAVAELPRDGVRYYTVTHLRTGLKAHPFEFGDLLAATECAEAFDAAFPDAASWPETKKDERAKAKAIWDAHMERDAYNRELEAHEYNP